MIEFRMDPQKMLEHYNTRYLPILGKRDPLAIKMTRDCHVEESLLQKIHLPVRASIRNLSKGKFGILFPEARNCLHQIASTCVRCCEQAEYSYDQTLGNIYVKLNTFHHPFENISLDPLGHIEVKAFNNARKVVKLWPLLVRCIDTGGVNCLMMESMQSKSVIGALVRLQFRMGRIKKVAMDAGTNLVELKRMSEESNGLLQVEEAVVHPVSSQFRNYCERGVQMVKKVARMMLRKRRNERLPILMREEAAIIMESACFSVNSIPYAHDKEGLYIAPNDILTPSYEMTSLADAVSPLANVNDLIQKMRLYQERVNEILRESFLTDWKRFGPGKLRINKYRKNVVPREKDLILIPADNNCDVGRYGVVENVLTPQTIRCRLRDGTMCDKPANLVVPLVANCLLD